MIFNIKLLLATVLFIAIIQDASSSDHSRNSKKHHLQRHHRSKLNNEVDNPTSCGESLCSSLHSYPKQKISAAWRNFDRLKNQDKSVFQRVLVDSGYLDQQFHPVKHDDHENFTLTHYNCRTEERSVYFPLEGKSSDDNELYYIINVSDFSQSVERKICKHCEPKESGEFCEQRLEHHKLLSIPVRKHIFTAQDVTVKTFEVPYSCKCYTV